eukprot:TRINITY_DN9939_c0_g1_i2.p1 TRINITY_DN9939_c0_g1~~TRINITY_DN9939_c0_g1_i2.p1  ORF type:complete len:517 (-),score=71.37 TRINITY_DN9939_c0_g1_i2:662-2212(-)
MLEREKNIRQQTGNGVATVHGHRYKEVDAHGKYMRRRADREQQLPHISLTCSIRFFEMRFRNKQRPQANDGSTILILPDDCVIEILMRTAVRDLRAFACTCRAHRLLCNDDHVLWRRRFLFAGGYSFPFLTSEMVASTGLSWSRLYSFFFPQATVSFAVNCVPFGPTDSFSPTGSYAYSLWTSGLESPTVVASDRKGTMFATASDGIFQLYHVPLLLDDSPFEGLLYPEPVTVDAQTLGRATVQNIAAAFNRVYKNPEFAVTKYFVQAAGHIFMYTTQYTPLHMTVRVRDFMLARPKHRDECGPGVFLGMDHGIRVLSSRSMEKPMPTCDNDRPVKILGVTLLHGDTVVLSKTIGQRLMLTNSKSSEIVSCNESFVSGAMCSYMRLPDVGVSCEENVVLGLTTKAELIQLLPTPKFLLERCIQVHGCGAIFAAVDITGRLFQWTAGSAAPEEVPAMRGRRCKSVTVAFDGTLAVLCPRTAEDEHYIVELRAKRLGAERALKKWLESHPDCVTKPQS